MNEPVNSSAVLSWLSISISLAVLPPLPDQSPPLAAFVSTAAAVLDFGEWASCQAGMDGDPPARVGCPGKERLKETVTSEHRIGKDKNPLHIS